MFFFNSREKMIRTTAIYLVSSTVTAGIAVITAICINSSNTVACTAWSAISAYSVHFRWKLPGGDFTLVDENWLIWGIRFEALLFEMKPDRTLCFQYKHYRDRWQALLKRDTNTGLKKLVFLPVAVLSPQCLCSPMEIPQLSTDFSVFWKISYYKPSFSCCVHHSSHYQILTALLKEGIKNIHVLYHII